MLMNHQFESKMPLMIISTRVNILFLLLQIFFCYERLHGVSFSENNQAGVVEAFTLPHDI